MRHESLLKLDRLACMTKSEAIATLKFLCQIRESNFARHLAERNPQWRLDVVEGQVRTQEQTSHVLAEASL